MKNRFGFIPIVLPAIVMVLIIGLINLAGPQATQAQQAGNVDAVDARLSALSLTVGELSPDFAADVSNYTAMVDNSVTAVTVNATPANTAYTATMGATGANTVAAATPLGSVDLTNEGVTVITITVAETTPSTPPEPSATYVIRLTRRAPDVRPTGPQLLTLPIDPGTGALTLTGKYGAATFDPDVGYYMVSVNYTVQSVTVTPTANAGIDWTISPGSQRITTGGSPDAADVHRVPLGVGPNEIVVNTEMTGATGKYTVIVTRQAPELAATGGIVLGTVSSDAAHPAPVLAPTYDPDTRTYNIIVDYAVDSTTVEGVTETDSATNISRVKSISPGDADGSTDAHDVKLPSGATTTITIVVEQRIADQYDPVDNSLLASTTGTYTVNIMREHPQLADDGDPTANPATDGLRLLYNVNDAPLAGTDNTFGLDQAYTDDRTSYKATVPYQHGYVTIALVAQTEVPPGDELETVLLSKTGSRVGGPIDDRQGDGGFQVDLDPGVTKTVVARVRSKGSPASAKRDYTIALTRNATPLDNLALCEGTPVSCPATEPTAAANTAVGEPLAADDITSPEIGLMPAGTSTPHEFSPNTTTYSAMVDYAVTSVTVSASNTEPSPATNRAISMATSTGYVTVGTPPSASGMTTAALVVGNNEIGVQSGITGNTSTYSLTVKRNAPAPTLRFVLLDEDGERLGDGAQQLNLDAQTRNYQFDERDVTNASFEDDDLILLDSLRVYTDMLDTGVRVSHNQITVNETEATALPIPSLPEGNFTLEFEVRYLTGNGNEEDFTTHRVSFVRPQNSQPMFPANHPLRGQQITLLHDEEFRPDGTNTVIELPFATGGDGTLEYELIGNEAKGSSEDLPSRLDYDEPTNSPNVNGQVTGVPIILDRSDAAVHHLILRVWDDDAITGSSDEDTIEFSIRIVRDASQITPPAVQTPDLAELFGIEVMYDDPVTSEVESPLLDADLDPEFDPNRKLYTATVPTDVDQVDIHITASSSATVRMNNTAAPATNSATTDFGSGTRHEWNGHRLSRGRVITDPNPYAIVVTDGGETMTYTLNVVREENTAPAFMASDQPDTLKYYEMIPVGGASALKAVTLPRPLKMNGGNGATTSWEYSLKRRLSTAQGLTGFLGLEFDSSSDMRTLSGTPELDTARTSPDRRLSDHSEVYAEYSVHDYDQDRSASDMDSLNVDIFVYRNATLGSLTVDGNRVDLTENKEVLTYRDSRLYSYKTEGGNYIPEYTQSLAHDATVATISAEAYASDPEIAVTYSVADTDPNTNGLQVAVSRGDNPVTITVTNATIVVQHVINLSVPGLEAESITVIEDEDARPGGAEFLNNVVELDPEFDRRGRDYTAMVETWVQSLRVSAVPVDSRAQVQVNDFAVPDAVGYRVVNLPNMGDTPNEITVGIHLADSTPVIYTIDVTRKADTAPEFPAGAVMDRECMVNKTIVYPIQLPKAMGGNGDLTYSVIDEDLPPGLMFDASTRQITGTPRLDEGYSSDFMVTYTVSDADGNNADSDKDTRTFTITITNDASAPCAQPDPQDDTVDPADRNTLSDLIVTYDKGATRDIEVTLDPDFSPTNGGPYTANVPPDATNIQVETVPAVTEAEITINNTRISGGEKLNLPPTATIVVTHAGLPDMTYTLNTVRESNTAPVFGDEIAAMTLEASVAMDPMQLPMASGGNGRIDYTLMDHQGGMPEGLTFDAATRELSGTPVLLRDSVKTVYQMTYTATDAQNESDSVMFMLTVCDASNADCVPTVPEPNPGYTPVELMVTRSSDGMSATLTWRPGDDAASQAVLAIDPSDLLASAMETFAELDGEADMATISGLTAGVDYIYVVAGFDADGNHKDASGNLYFARYAEGN